MKKLFLALLVIGSMSTLSAVKLHVTPSDTGVTLGFVEDDSTSAKSEYVLSTQHLQLLGWTESNPSMASFYATLRAGKNDTFALDVAPWKNLEPCIFELILDLIQKITDGDEKISADLVIRILGTQLASNPISGHTSLFGLVFEIARQLNEVEALSACQLRPIINKMLAESACMATYGEEPICESDPSWFAASINRTFNRSTFYPNFRIEQVLRGNQDFVAGICFSPDGKSLFSAGWDGTAHIFNVADGSPRQCCQLGDGPLYACAWSPDGERVSVASKSGFIHIFDGKKFDKPDLSSKCHDRAINAIAWHPTQNCLATASDDHSIHIVTKKGKIKGSLTGHTNWVTSVAWSPDGKLLASGSTDKTIKFWDVATKTCIKTLTDPKGTVATLAWSHDGAYLAGGISAAENNIIIWHMPDCKKIATYTGHKNVVYGLSWAHKSNILASASFDENVKIWDPFSQTCIKKIAGHNNHVMAVAWSPDDTCLASAGRDKTILLSTNSWLSRLSTKQEALLLACQAQKNLSEQQILNLRSTYLSLPTDARIYVDRTLQAPFTDKEADCRSITCHFTCTSETLDQAAKVLNFTEKNVFFPCQAHLEIYDGSQVTAVDLTWDQVAKLELLSQDCPKIVHLGETFRHKYVLAAKDPARLSPEAFVLMKRIIDQDMILSATGEIKAPAEAVYHTVRSQFAQKNLILGHDNTTNILLEMFALARALKAKSFSEIISKTLVNYCHCHVGTKMCRPAPFEIFAHDLALDLCNATDILMSSRETRKSSGRVEIKTKIDEYEIIPTFMSTPSTKSNSFSICPTNNGNRRTNAKEIIAETSTGNPTTITITGPQADKPPANLVHSCHAVPLAWSPDGRYLLAYEDEHSTVCIWDIQDHTRKFSIPKSTSIVSWFPDSSFFVCVDQAGFIRIHSVENAVTYESAKSEGISPQTTIRVSLDGQYIAVMTPTKEKTTMQIIRRRDLALIHEFDAVGASFMCWLPGNYLATATNRSHDAVVVLSNATSNQLINEFSYCGFYNKKILQMEFNERSSELGILGTNIRPDELGSLKLVLAKMLIPTKKDLDTFAAQIREKKSPAIRSSQKSSRIESTPQALCSFLSGALAHEDIEAVHAYLGRANLYSDDCAYQSSTFKQLVKKTTQLMCDRREQAERLLDYGAEFMLLEGLEKRLGEILDANELERASDFFKEHKSILETSPRFGKLASRFVCALKKLPGDEGSSKGR